jgi:hypothetical protein
MFLFVHEAVIELPDAELCEEQDDEVLFLTIGGRPLARFQRGDVIAYSKLRESIAGGLKGCQAQAAKARCG